MKARLTFAIAALCALLALPVFAGVHEDMVALDRAYIPALALTNQPKPDASKRAMERLRTEWNAFRTTYASAPAGYAPDAWAATDREVEAAVATAEKNLAAGKNLDAHEDLERVREAQYVLRRGAKVPYFMDDLTAFHSAMEKLVGAVAGRTPATLSDADLVAVRDAYAAADRTWQEVLANRARTAQHGVAGEKLAAVQAQIDVETRTLAELKAALAAGDRAKVIEKSIATKPAFSKLFTMFGDFASVTGA
jgi:hypothetical protein